MFFFFKKQTPPVTGNVASAENTAKNIVRSILPVSRDPRPYPVAPGLNSAKNFRKICRKCARKGVR